MCRCRVFRVLARVWWPGAGIMEADDRQVTTVQPFHHRHSTNRVSWSVTIVGERASHLTSSFADDGNSSRYSVCRMPMVEWRLDCQNCRHLTVVGLHDTCPWTNTGVEVLNDTQLLWRWDCCQKSIRFFKALLLCVVWVGHRWGVCTDRRCLLLVSVEVKRQIVLPSGRSARFAARWDLMAI